MDRHLSVEFKQVSSFNIKSLGYLGGFIVRSRWLGMAGWA